jgi:hypothetical protein
MRTHLFGSRSFDGFTSRTRLFLGACVVALGACTIQGPEVVQQNPAPAPTQAPIPPGEYPSSDGGGAGPVTDPSVVGPGGGVIVGEGATLTIPAGALSEPVSIAIRKTAWTSPIAGSPRVVGPAYEFSPDGLYFNGTARLQITGLTDAVVNRDSVPLAFLSEHADELDLEPAKRAGSGTVEVDIRHFSRGRLVMDPLPPEGQTVLDVIDNGFEKGRCSTRRLLPLSRQIKQRLDTTNSGIFAPLPSRLALSEEAAALPFVLPKVSADLASLLKNVKREVFVTSAWRSPIQQFALEYWQFAGASGCPTKAAPAGMSAHETGKAVDIGGTTDKSEWNLALTKAAPNQSPAFKWLGADDLPHFTHQSPSTDVRPLALRAFQTLWNDNNPCDPIPSAELGGLPIGGATTVRIGKSPAAGFDSASPVTLPVAGGGCERPQVCCAGLFGNVPRCAPESASKAPTDACAVYVGGTFRWTVVPYVACGWTGSRTLTVAPTRALFNNSFAGKSTYTLALDASRLTFSATLTTCGVTRFETVSNARVRIVVDHASGEAEVFVDQTIGFENIGENGSMGTGVYTDVGGGYRVVGVVDRHTLPVHVNGTKTYDPEASYGGSVVTLATDLVLQSE